MNQAERDWLDWLKRAKDGVAERWVRALQVEMKTKGDAVVIHGLRGRQSNRRIEDKIKAQALKIVKLPGWHDFGPKFATEQLAVARSAPPWWQLTAIDARLRQC